MLKYAIVLTVAFLLATQSHFAWSAFDPPQGKLAAREIAFLADPRAGAR